MNMMMWIGLTYIAGSYAGFLLGRGKLEDAIDLTIDSLINNGFLRHKKNKDGEVEIMKWNENES
jgi:hypothetical protein